jgi:hypothetical protein
MTLDLDRLLRAADPVGGDDRGDAALLVRVRERVDHQRMEIAPAGQRRSPWPRRLALVAAAAAVLTAVPLVLSAVTGEDGGPPGLITPAVADNGEIYCGAGYTSAVTPEDSPVRLLPNQLPAGWSYAQIFVREHATTGSCVPPSLTALRTDVNGLVTGRIAVTGPVEARVDQGKIVAATVPDTLFGHAARRFDLQPHDVVFHRWLWTDEQGRQWSVEASGMPLEEARQALAAVSIDGSDVAWNGAAAPGWTLVHLREGTPYGVAGQLTWSVELTDGSTRRMFQVWASRGSEIPLVAGTGVGEQVTTIDGHPAVLSQVRVNQAPPGTETDTPPGSVTQPVLLEIAPGTVAFSFSMGDDLPQVEQMLASLQQVPRDDPRLAQYGTD